MKTVTIGILAHVDAGKTTLSEGLLYESGAIREVGRVDHGDAYLDTYALEKQRGITIFSKQAVLAEVESGVAEGSKADSDKNDTIRYMLIDTPGHVDFAPEMERVLSVLDYAVLVISATDGIQGHTRTCLKLLDEYGVPVFIFVNKMDMEGVSKDALMEEFAGEVPDKCVDMSGVFVHAEDAKRSDDKQKEINYIDIAEDIAMLDEDVMESYLETGKVSGDDVARLIYERKMYPCFFGSALRGEGVSEFYAALLKYAVFTGEYDVYDKLSGKTSELKDDNNDFGARVFKISRDDKGNRLTHIRVTSGEIRPKQTINVRKRIEGSVVDKVSETEETAVSEKVDQLRLYSGDRYEMMDVATEGNICALTGLKNTYPGQGLGVEDDLESPVIEPVLSYTMELPDGVSAVTFLPKVREIAEEQPELHIEWDEVNESISIRVMGEVQTEVLRDVIAERYGVEVSFGKAGIVYKETVAKAAEGIGHYEPLRHYAEVHLGIEPMTEGSGFVIDTDVSEDDLALNWQRLICTHLLERQHPGTKIGAPITDVRVTVIGGRAHLKHTEGGDFRQATYRALRQGLMQAECRVLEPYYAFRISLPQTHIGRAMTDVERMGGSFSISTDNTKSLSGVENTHLDNKGNVQREQRSILLGTAPVSAMSEYPRELAAYSGGEGEISLEFAGYKPVHDEEELVSEIGYDPLADEDNPTGSVFCAHGAGYYVPWDEVAEHAHVQTDWQPKYIKSIGTDGKIEYADGISGLDEYGEFIIDENKSEDVILSDEAKMLQKMDFALGVEEIDDILAKAGASNKRAPRNSRRRAAEKTVRRASRPTGAAKPRKTKEKIGDYLLVDGYNVIHAWKELSSLAAVDMEQARGKLQDILCNYQGYRSGDVILVFDAYRVAGHSTESFDYHNIHVVYTKTAETADQYIERFSVEKADRYHVTVVTSDGLEQIIIRGAGAHLLSARDFEEEVARVQSEMSERMV